MNQPSPPLPNLPGGPQQPAMPGAPIHFLEQAQAQHPGVAADLAEFADLYDKKLWHELTVKLTEALGKPDFHQGDFLVQLYRRAATPVARPRRPEHHAYAVEQTPCDQVSHYTRP